MSMCHLCAETRNSGGGDDTRKDDQSLQALRHKRKIPSHIPFYGKTNLSSV